MRKQISISSGSMADVAFLLLLFFLITTTIEHEQGIQRTLPPFSLNQVQAPISKRNVLEINLSQGSKLLVNGQFLDPSELVEFCIAFIENTNNKLDQPAHPRDAIILIKMGEHSDYDQFIQVQNAISLAYKQMRDKKAMSLFQKNYSELNLPERERIRYIYPMHVSERIIAQVGI